MPSPQKNIVFITEWKNNTGAGHLSRCLSLRDAFHERGYETSFIIDSEKEFEFKSSEIKPVILDWKSNPEDIKSFISDSSILVIDSYLAAKEQLKYLANITDYPVFISDVKLNYFPKGIVIIGNSFAHELDIINSKEVNYLLGIKYALLRKEFWDIEKKEISPGITKILISLGNTDPKDLKIKIAEILARGYPHSEITVLSNRDFRIYPKRKNLTILSRRLSAKEMANLFLQHDLVISNGGQTLIECIRVGVPTIAVKMADNQVRNIKTLAEKELTFKILDTANINSLRDQVLDYLNILKDHNKRLKINISSKQFIDGQGARRASKEILDYYGS